jgi:superfamily II DNA/RNA helicase
VLWQVAAVLDPDTLNASMPILPDYGQDMLMGVHLVVGTPECLSVLAKRGHIPFNNARFVVVDEADECARRSSNELDALVQTCKGKVCADGRPRSMLFAGASISLPEVMSPTVEIQDLRVEGKGFRFSGLELV